MYKQIDPASLKCKFYILDIWDLYRENGYYDYLVEQITPVSKLQTCPWMTASLMLPPQLPALPTANPTVDAESEPAPVYPPILINIIKSLERLLPQVLTDGLMWIDSSPNLWKEDFWTDTLLTPQGNASYKARGSVGQRELRPHVLPILQIGFDREGVHTIDAMFWFEKIFKMLKRRGNITDEEKLILRDLAELHGEKIVAYKPQAFGREEMRQHKNCKVHPNTSANSAVQIPCPLEHH